MASATASAVRPSITVSSTQSSPSASALAGRPRRVGHQASLVDAGSALYFEPTLEPERTTPPGKGAMTPGTRRSAATARSAAASAAAALAATKIRLPPPTALTIGVVSSQRNSPSITGTRQ